MNEARRAVKEIDTLFLDTSSLAYRAFFALPVTVTDAQGRAVNAVRGFMDMTRWLIAERRPKDVVAVSDADWRPAFRVAAYAGYKEARPEDPPELPRQFDVIAEVLDAAGIVRVEAPELEADDALATLVHDLPEERRVAIVTGDRDLMAVVRDPQVRLIYPARGVRNAMDIDAAEVHVKHGVGPELYPEYATLRGDPSDGLPGVLGIGPVRAAALLTEYGSIDGILANLDRLPPKQARAIEEARGYLEAMKVVVPLITDAKLVATEPAGLDEERITSVAQEHNLGSSATRLAAALRETKDVG
ncbi:MAG: 5'-3' exonuclease [Actinobacteria bacterium]|nr:5'-3' exonuclease [Actinomycetota bacterium]